MFLRLRRLRTIVRIRVRLCIRVVVSFVVRSVVLSFCRVCLRLFVYMSFLRVFFVVTVLPFTSPLQLIFFAEYNAK